MNRSRFLLLTFLLSTLALADIPLPQAANAAIYGEAFEQIAGGPDTAFALSSVTNLSYPGLSDSLRRAGLRTLCASMERYVDSTGGTMISCSTDSMLGTLSYDYRIKPIVGRWGTSNSDTDCDTVVDGTVRRWIWTRNSQGQCSEGHSQIQASGDTWEAESDTVRLQWNGSILQGAVRIGSTDTVQSSIYVHAAGSSRPQAEVAYQKSGGLWSIRSRTTYAYRNTKFVSSDDTVFDSTGAMYWAIHLWTVRGSTAISPRSPTAMPFSVHRTGGAALFSNSSRNAAHVSIVRPDGAQVANLQVAPGATATWTPEGSGILLWSAHSGGATWSGILATGR
jgi:hypothetical protein